MAERHDNTIELLKTGLIVSPNHPGKRFMLGRAYLKLGQMEDAVREFERVKSQ